MRCSPKAATASTCSERPAKRRRSRSSSDRGNAGRGALGSADVAIHGRYRRCIADRCRAVDARGARSRLQRCARLPPFYYKPIDNIGLLAYFDALINRVGADLRLYLYNFPQLSGVPYPLEFVQALKEKYPRQLLGLKDSSGDTSYSIAMAAGVADFDVFPSAEGTIERRRPLWLGRLHLGHGQRHRARRRCGLENAAPWRASERLPRLPRSARFSRAHR